jgi:hypothetical protein
MHCREIAVNSCITGKKIKKLPFIIKSLIGNNNKRQ